MKELIKLYFTPTAPFEASGEKKNEFPDAIALLSLEAWARANSTKILAISEDTGWASYAKNSEWIDVETNLAVALQRFQAHTEEARGFVHSLLADLDAAQKPDLLRQIEHEIGESVANTDPPGEADAAFHVEIDGVSLSYVDFEFIRKNDQYDFKIVQVGKDRIVASIGMEIGVRVGKLAILLCDPAEATRNH